MKKAFALIAAASLLCTPAVFPAMSANAIEAATYYEYTQQNKNVFSPDPSLRCGEATVDGLKFDLYDQYALLADCEDTSITKAVIPAYVNDLPVVGMSGLPFAYCRELTTIELPDDFKYFRWDSLCNTFVTRSGSGNDEEKPMPTVTLVSVSENNNYYTLCDGLLYSKDMKTLIGCPPGLDMSDVYISSKTDTIGDYAFYACMGLKQANIPDTVKHINNNAFTACLNLESVTLPESITSISGDTFYYCQSLTDVNFKGNVHTIGFGAFAECPAMESFNIPDSVTYIGSKAFEGDSFIEIDNGIHYVDNWAVNCDDDITDISVREGTVGISEWAFMLKNDCKSLYVPSSVMYVGELFYSNTRGEVTVIDYHAPYINERTLIGAKTTSDIFIYDSECDIFDSEKTIPATYRYTPEDADIIWVDGIGSEKEVEGNTVIHGYIGSTAQEYADKYGREFIPIDKLQGDLNGDGIFNVADVLTFQKYLMNGDSDSIKPGFSETADLCKDGKLNVFDMIAMRDLLASK